MVFGAKEKPAKPIDERKCPFYTIAGSTASSCLKGNCTMWQDQAGACAFNVLAQTATANRG